MDSSSDSSGVTCDTEIKKRGGGGEISSENGGDGMSLGQMSVRRV